MKTFKQFLLEQSKDITVLYPGKFKPPHKGHYNVLLKLLSVYNANKAIIFISAIPRDGVTAEKSAAIWRVYLKRLGVTVDVQITQTPVRAVYEHILNHPHEQFALGVGEKDDDVSRYADIVNKPEKYHNVEPIKSVDLQEGGISGTDIRKKILQKSADVFEFIPDEIRKFPADLVEIREILDL